MAHKLCACGRRNDSALDVCPPCMADRVTECRAALANPRFNSPNPACRYAWHKYVNDCRLCTKEGVYLKGGCEPCAKCHFCGEVHIIPERLLKAVAA